MRQMAVETISAHQDPSVFTLFPVVVTIDAQCRMLLVQKFFSLSRVTLMAVVTSLNGRLVFHALVEEVIVTVSALRFACRGIHVRIVALIAVPFGNGCVKYGPPHLERVTGLACSCICGQFKELRLVG